MPVITWGVKGKDTPITVATVEPYIKVRGKSGIVHQFCGCIGIRSSHIFEAKDVHYVCDFYKDVDVNVVTNFYAKLLDIGSKGGIYYADISDDAKRLAELFRIELSQTTQIDEYFDALHKKYFEILAIG
jgi:hypothetical protein